MIRKSLYKGKIVPVPNSYKCKYHLQGPLPGYLLNIAAPAVAAISKNI
jgi:hypothetical protein